MYEDLTVNQQQAQFQAQQFQQSQANIMANLQGAAGGSGVAALAQSLANQGHIAAQQASASIGQQEAANQKLMAQGEQDVLRREQLKLQGAQQAEMARLGGIEQQRAAEKEKSMAMMGMSSGQLSSSNQAVEAARAQIAKDKLARKESSIFFQDKLAPTEEMVGFKSGGKVEYDNYLPDIDDDK